MCGRANGCREGCFLFDAGVQEGLVMAQSRFPVRSQEIMNGEDLIG